MQDVRDLFAYLKTLPPVTPSIAKDRNFAYFSPTSGLLLQPLLDETTIPVVLAPSGDTQRGDDMKFVSAAALALIGCLVGFNSANGAAMKTTPTTKILAIGTINPGFEQSQVFAVLPEEVRETVDLYLDGKIEQWYSLQGKPGVAFIINVTDPAVAHEMLEKLPLGKAHMMSFELIPIGPLNPLRFLQGMQPKP